MDTLCSDLIELLSAHFDVLPTVFLTNNHIELEDAEELVYERRIWPWLLYDIRKSYEYVFMCALKHRDDLGILECMNQSWKLLSPPVVDNIYIEAHGYNNRQVIKATRKYLYDCYYANEYAIYYTALAGHIELFNDMMNSVANDIELFMDGSNVRFAYKGGHSSIIETSFIQDALEFHYSSATLGAIAGNHLELMKELIVRYSTQKIKIMDLSYGPNTFDTFKYLLENNIVVIDDNKTINAQIFLRMITDNAPVKLFEWFLFDWLKEQINITELVKYCILLNNIHYIRRLIPSNYQSVNEQLQYLFEHYKLEKEDMEYRFSRTSVRIGCRGANRRFLYILRSKV